ncbi:MAG: hypothetical protein IJQ10_00160 [Clostridia bacterium]|nr:hypothetical protein [Clostridia bacterium]
MSKKIKDYVDIIKSKWNYEKFLKLFINEILDLISFCDMLQQTDQERKEIINHFKEIKDILIKNHNDILTDLKTYSKDQDKIKDML